MVVKPETIFSMTVKIVFVVEKIFSMTEKIFTMTEKILTMTEKILTMTEKIFTMTEKIFTMTVKIVFVVEKIFSIAKTMVSVTKTIFKTTGTTLAAARYLVPFVQTMVRPVRQTFAHRSLVLVEQSFANPKLVVLGAYRWSVLDVVLCCFSSPAVKKLKRLFPSSSPIPSLVLFYFFVSLVFWRISLTPRPVLVLLLSSTFPAVRTDS